MSLSSIANRALHRNQNNTNSQVDAPREKKPSSSLLKLSGNAVKYAYVSYQIHNAKKDVLTAAKQLKDAKSTQGAAEENHVHSSAIEKSVSKSADALSILNSKNDTLKKLTAKQTKIEDRIESIGTKRSEEKVAKQEEEKAKQAVKDGIKVRKEEINKQIKGLKTQLSQVGSSSTPSTRQNEESISSDDVSRSENAQSGF